MITDYGKEIVNRELSKPRCFVLSFGQKVYTGLSKEFTEGEMANQKMKNINTWNNEVG